MIFNYIFLGFIGGQEILIIGLIILLLFGGRKIPQLMRGLGRGIKEFKDGTSGITKDLDLTSDLDNDESDKDKSDK